MTNPLYEYCKEQLKALGINRHGRLQGRHTGGFDGHYMGKHILRVAKTEYQGLTIDVKKPDDCWRGWEPVGDKQTLNKVFDDYIKPRIEEEAKLDKWLNGFKTLQEALDRGK